MILFDHVLGYLICFIFFPLYLVNFAKLGLVYGLSLHVWFSFSFLIVYV